MSGRLVILPHKSWNVWNQDNREKVLRDERLHAEEEEERVRREKASQQRHNLEILRGRGGDLSVIESKDDSLSHTHSHTGNNNDKSNKNNNNNKDKALRDWALGEGSFEHQKSSPWYAKRRSEHTDTHTDTHADTHAEREAAEDAELAKKARLDPMADILIKRERDREREKDSHYREKDSERERERERERLRIRGGDMVKEERRERERERDRERDDPMRVLERREKERETRTHTHSSADVSVSVSVPTHKPSSLSRKGVDIEELRRKRLAREKEERKKASVMLAERDIYGKR